MYRLNPSVADQIVDANEQLVAGNLDNDEFQFLVAEAVTRAPSEQVALQAVFPFAERIARTLHFPVERNQVKTAQSIVKMLRSAAGALPPSAPSVEFVSVDETPAQKKMRKRAEREQLLREEREATVQRASREQAETAAFFEAQKAAGRADVFDVEYEDDAPVDVFQGQISEDDLYVVQKVIEIDERARANIEAEELFANDPEELEKLQRRTAQDEEDADAFFKGLILIGYKTSDIQQAQFRVWKALQAAALRMARRELRGRKDLATSAAELAAEAAIQAYFKLHRYKGRGKQAEAFSRLGKAKVSTWVGSIVRNLVRTIRTRQAASTIAGQSGLTALTESLGFSGVQRSLTVSVQRGDTVEAIALRFYGTPTKAKLIRQKNKIPADAQPAAGTKLKLVDVPERGVSRVTGEAADIAMSEAESSPWAGTYGDVMHERMLAERLESERESEEMANKEDALVWEALQALPKNDRYILMLRIPQGIYNLPDGTVHQQTEPNDYEYIGKVLGIAKGTVMSRLSRARNKVFEALGDKIKPPYFGELTKGILQLAAHGRQGKVDTEGHVDTLTPLPAVAAYAPELIPVLATPNWPERLQDLSDEWQETAYRASQERDKAWLGHLLQPSKEQRQMAWREKMSGVGPQLRKTGALPGVSGYAEQRLVYDPSEDRLVLPTAEERIGFYQRDPSRRRANPYVPGMESADFYYETPMDLLFLWEDGLINQEQYDTCMAAIDAELSAQAA